MEVESATFRLFPDVPLADWVHLWKCGYSEDYGGGSDVEYANLMNSVHGATEFGSTLEALENFFGWKDRLKNRWISVLHSLTSEQWEQLKIQKEIPAFWTNGVVYNVFLWHVATRGARPLIDQHSWRAYCWIVGRTHKPDFPSGRKQASAFYKEYETWFNRTAAICRETRDLDRALMAFGQFCGSFPGILKYCFPSV